MATYVFNLLSLIIFLAPSALATTSTSGMDMSIDGAMAPSGSMHSYFHFTLGDTLWFQGWVIKSKGVMAGACIALFLLAVSERSLAAIRATAEVAWRDQAETAYTKTQNAASHSTIEVCETQSSHPRLSKLSTLARIFTFRYISPPFIPANDIIRGILYASQVGLMFQLMLAVMTFQSLFILSITLGLGVGEVIFGRYISATAGPVTG